MTITERSVSKGGWRVTSRRGPISGTSETEAIRATLGTHALPEMLFGSSCLELEHVESGLKLRFCASEALAEVCDVDVPKVKAAEQWSDSHREDPHAINTLMYDWTFTTSYRGTMISPSTRNWKWTSTNRRIDRGKISRKDPILFYDEMVLYESELDDNGASQLTVKLRVMPNCAYVLLRFWLRIDGVMVRLRETRLYVGFGGNHPMGMEVLREHVQHEASIGDLREKDTFLESGAFKDAESTSQALQAMSPAMMKQFGVEELVCDG